MPLETTAPGVATTSAPSLSHQVPRYGLVLVASPSAPERVGELAFSPDGKDRFWGRGGVDIEKFATPAQHRPGETLPPPFLAACLQDSIISREQFITRATPGGIDLEVVGNCLTLVNGEQAQHASLRPGHTVMLKGAGVFVCVCRPLMLPTVPSMGPLHRFGGPDPWGIVGESFLIWQLRCELARAAKGQTHVLIQGETGTGKEKAAHMVHALSDRANGPFVTHNSAVSTETLIQVQLFGNMANFPTPGQPATTGLVPEAHGGMLYLDEAGELPERAQAQLLRVMQNHEYEVMGQRGTRRVDVRIVAATNRDKSVFREDFYNRFVTKVRIPPLRERPEDIPLLARHILLEHAGHSETVRKFFAKGAEGQMYPRFSGSFMDELVRHPLSGNMRELEEILLRSVHASDEEDTLRLPSKSILPPSTVLSSAPVSAPPSTAKSGASSDKEKRTGPPPKAEFLSMLAEEKGNLAAVARRHGVTRPTIYRWMEELGIQRNETKP